MDESLEIKSTPLKDFDIRCCIICQKKDSKGLAPTANRRSKLMEAARIRKIKCGIDCNLLVLKSQLCTTWTTNAIKNMFSRRLLKILWY